MTLALKLLCGVVGGFAMHWFHKPASAFGEKWGLIVKYVIGWLGALPFLLLLLPDEYREEVIKAYLLTGGAFGSGVFVGHVLDGGEDCG